MTPVSEVMSTEVASCRMHDTMNHAARLMWERDCGCVPIVDDESRVIGVITDRDICMATYTQGKTLTELSVSFACSTNVKTCRTDDSIALAEEIMTTAQVRRLPVVDSAGVLAGIVSLSDLAHYTKRADAADKAGRRTLTSVFEAVTRPRNTNSRAGTQVCRTEGDATPDVSIT